MGMHLETLMVSPLYHKSRERVYVSRLVPSRVGFSRNQKLMWVESDETEDPAIEWKKQRTNNEPARDRV